MTIFFKRSTSWFALAILSVVALFSVRAYAQEVPCPFNDDSIIFYSSPTSLAKAGCAMNDKYSFQDELAVVNKLLDKADAEIAKHYNDEDFPKAQFDYYQKLFSEATGLNSFTRAALVSYFKYVDAVVVAAELGDSFKETKDKGAEPLSVTIVFNANPSALDARNYLSDDKRFDLKVTKEEENYMAGKATIEYDGDKKATVFFSGVKFKAGDADKYAVIFGSRANTEKKAERLLKSGEFFAKRLAEPGLVDERIFKEKAFKILSEAIVETRNIEDDGIKSAIKIVDSLKAARLVVNADADGFKSELCVETTDEETTQNYVDLANGGLVVLKLAATNKDELKPEEKLGLELVNSIKVVRDGVKAKATGGVSVEQLKKLFQIVKEKCDD